MDLHVVVPVADVPVAVVQDVLVVRDVRIVHLATQPVPMDV